MLLKKQEIYKSEVTMILLIDNYDSFTFNLYQEIGKLYEDIKVVRNDEISIEEIEAMKPKAIVVSPGPGYPEDAGISIKAIRYFSGKIPILGVCLGHQSIAEAFGGKIVQSDEIIHGKSCEVKIDKGCELFSDLPEKILAARYNSLVADRNDFPECLKIIATDEKGNIMALMHKNHKTYGLQFHPESILTETGLRILSNFLYKIAGLSINEANAPAIPRENRNELKKYISKIIDGNDLTEDEAYQAMNCIMSDKATDSQIASLITALRMKGETIEEITGFARVMREKAKAVKLDVPAIDIVGTGGDMANTFNISTTSAFVMAGAGLNVAKHGNRGVSSKSGAADILEELGVRISMSPSEAASCMEKCGVCFLFAQSFHGSMRYASAPRREIGVRSVFNLLGPLANPAMTDYILLGVYDENLMESMANVLVNLGIKRAMLVHGNDGLDEISVSDKTTVYEIRDGEIKKYEIDPRDYNIKLYDKSEVVGGTPKDNSKITLDILNGFKGATRDIVLMNAGCALYVGNKAKSIAEGIEMAKNSIDSGEALKKLNELIKFSNSLAEGAV